MEAEERPGPAAVVAVVEVVVAWDLRAEAADEEGLSVEV